ncbi:GAF domain-containing protein [Desulfobacterales bacterium HSG16]|nr:GAF domain-containing protein [Desulfobacterales bacterium HSG16]
MSHASIIQRVVRNGITRNIIFMFFMFGIIPILVFSLILSSAYLEKRKKHITQIQIEAVRRVSLEISSNLENSISRIEVFSRYLRHHFKNNNHSHMEVLSYDFLKYWPEYDMITIADKEGKEIIKASHFRTFKKFESKNRSHELAFIDALSKKQHISGIHLTAFKQLPRIFVTLPVLDNGENVVGVLEVRIRLNNIWEMTSRYNIGKNRTAYIVDSDGAMISSPEISSVLQKKDISSISIIEEFLKGKTGVFEYVKPDDSNVIGYSASISLTGWGIIIEEPADAVYNEIYRIAGTNGWIVLTIAFCAIIFGLFFSSRQILQPVRRIEEYAEQVLKEKFGIKINVKKAHEIGQLEDFFKHIISSLKLATVTRNRLKDEEAAKKQMQAALKESENNYQAVLDKVNDAIIIFDIETGKLFDINQKTCEIFGYSTKDMDSLNLEAICWQEPPYTAENAREWIQKASRQEPGLIEWKYKTKTGAFIWAEVNLKKAIIGSRKRLLAIIRDITEQKESEKILRRQNEYLAALHETTLGLIRRLDLDELIETVMHRAGVLTDSRHGFIYMYDSNENELVVRYATGRLQTAIGNRINAGHGFAGKVHKTGKPMMIEDYSTWEDRLPGLLYQGIHFIIACPLKSRDVTIGVIGLAHFDRDKIFSENDLDILSRFAQLASIALVNARLYTSLQEELSQRKHAEEEKERIHARLQHVYKMEAIGTLAGGIAHNFNNLLMAIQGNASLILQTIEPDDNSMFPRIKKIEQYVEDGAELTRQLLNFSRGERYEVEPTDINEIIRTTALMFGNTRKEISIHHAYEKDIWTVETDRNQVEQVMLNIYINAWQAMPEGGDLFLKTENINLDNSMCRSLNLKPGKYVKTSVTDTGTGMDEEVASRIFEPFFTTKEMGRGTGMGLAASYRIITNHSGMITVTTEKGKGSCFDIFLPVVEAAAAKKIQQAKTGKKKSSGTILLVDDEEMLLDVASQMLVALGYQVIVAQNGAESIEIFKQHHENIMLVILDMIMPGKSGRETLEDLKKIDPDVKILLASGYSANDKIGNLDDPVCKGFIQKPFNLKRLSEALGNIFKEE